MLCSYSYELIFSYTNPGSADMVYNETYEEKITTYKKQLYSSEFTLEMSASVLTTNAIGSTSASVDTSFMSRFFSETTMEQTTEVLRKKEFSVTVGPGETAKMYQIVCQCTGMPAYNGGISDSTEEVPVVYMVIKEGVVLGLHEIFQVFKRTVPSKDNKKEWEAIRNCVIGMEDNPDDQYKFKKIVEQFNNTHPGSQNKKEWEAIRGTCSEILKVLNGNPKHDDYTLQMKKYMARLMGITPGSANKKEWEEIRKYSSSIYDIITPFVMA